MPALALEPFVCPPDLLQVEPAVGDSWWALYTRARNEKALMRKLSRQERHYYCPVVPRRDRSLTTRLAYLPLFSNYVFLCGTELDRYAAVCTGHVANCLPIPNAAQFVAQMRSIQRMIDGGLELELAPQFEAGAAIRVKTGPLKGLEGRVVKHRSRYRFVINVDFLQQGASTIIDGWDLERL
jgi:hypothetical protein